MVKKTVACEQALAPGVWDFGGVLGGGGGEGKELVLFLPPPPPPSFPPKKPKPRARELACRLGKKRTAMNKCASFEVKEKEITGHNHLKRIGKLNEFF